MLQLCYISVLYLKTPSSFWWLDVCMDNRSSEEQDAIFKHQYLLKLHNLWQNQFSHEVQVGITITVSDVKALGFSVCTETLVSLLKTWWLKSKFSSKGEQSQKKKVDFHSLQSFFDLAWQVKNVCLEGKNMLSCLLLTLKNPLLVMLMMSWSQTALRTSH